MQQKPSGRLLVSVPSAQRPGLDGAHRQADGRLFTPYSVDELALLFERIGFRDIGRWHTPDALQRDGLGWSTLLLERHDDGNARAVDQIEGILNRDRKVATSAPTGDRCNRQPSNPQLVGHGSNRLQQIHTRQCTTNDGCVTPGQLS